MDNEKEGQENTVVIKGHAFNPPTLTVKEGERATWKNEDDESHTVTSSDDEDMFDSGPFGKGETFSFTFDKVGEYDYYCSIHPDMKGKIVVSSKE